MIIPKHPTLIRRHLKAWIKEFKLNGCGWQKCRRG